VLDQGRIVAQFCGQTIAIVKEHMTESRILELPAALEQQLQTLGKAVGPGIHLSQMRDDRFAVDHRSGGEPAIQNAAHVSDGVPFDGAQQVEFDSSHAEHPRSFRAGAARIAA
jgi:hypothetical protein